MKGKVQGNETEMNGKLKGNGTEMEGRKGKQREIKKITENMQEMKENEQNIEHIENKKASRFGEKLFSKHKPNTSQYYNKEKMYLKTESDSKPTPN